MRLPPLPNENDDGSADAHYYCNATASNSFAPDRGHHLALQCELEAVPREEPSWCWLDLVSSSAVIAHHFPVPSRNEEMGLEIPIGILAHLAGVHHVVEFNGGVVMKGPTSMLLPVERTYDVVQWHLVSSRETNGGLLTYQDGLQQCRQRMLVDKVDTKSLHHTRAVVGWCGHAVTRLGLDEMNYDNLEYSAAAYDKPALSFSGVAIGVQHFATGQANFKPGPKDHSRWHRERKGTYRDVLNWAATTKILLYDTAEKRAWLVRADEVILHVIQKQRFDRPFVTNGQPVKLKIGSSAADTLSLNKTSVIRDNGDIDDEDEHEMFKDLVQKTWSLIEAHVAWEVELGRSQGREVNLPMREELAGFEFMAIAEERSPYVRKRCKISGKTNGGWISLVNDICPLVLFASGFEDVILPDYRVLMESSGTQTDPLCHSWRSVPKDCDYLATRTETIVDLYYTSGHRLDRKCLTNSGLLWHQSGLVFGPCQEPGSYRCFCNRLQQVMPGHHVGTVKAPLGDLQPDGAVIFDRSSFDSSPALSKRKAPTSKDKGKGKSLYSLPNSGQLFETQANAISDDGKSRDDEILSSYEMYDAISNEDANESDGKGITPDIAGSNAPSGSSTLATSESRS